MKRDRRLFATSALGLLLALPYPGSSFARDQLPSSDGPQAVASQAMPGTMLAQNEQSPDENRKKHHGHGGEQQGGGEGQHAAPRHEAQPRHQAQQGGLDQGGDQERGGQDHGRHAKRGGEQHQAEQPNPSAAAPNAAQGGERAHRQHQAEQLNAQSPASNEPQGGKDHHKRRQAEQPGAGAPAANASQGEQEHHKRSAEERQKQHQDQSASQSPQSEAQQPSAPQGEETQHERRKHKKNGEPNGQAQSQKPENGSASQQSTRRQKQGSSTGEAQGSQPSASSQEERHHHGHKNGADKGEAQSTQGAGHLSTQQGASPSSQPAQNGAAAQQQKQQNQPAENSKQQEGQAAQQQKQGEKGAPQLPEGNATQQPRPDFHDQGHGRHGQAQNGEGHGRPQNAAPVFDSQKRPFGNGKGDHNGQAGNQPSPNASSQGAAQFGPAPKSDQAAQTEVKHGQIESIDSVQGKRVQRDQLPPLKRPKGADVVKETDNRVIIQLGDRMIVRDHDQRIAHDARDVYYEDLPHDRRRETVLRPDGSKVVTIRNAYGDVIRRSRIMPDGHELVLVYVDNRDLERDRDNGWGDPGADLPPMRLTVPEDDYILDASEIHDPDRYYEFLEQPPVERIPRLYSLGEVKRSARIRDMIPRIDLDTINFDFGSASIGESEVSKLQAVAEAIQRILKKNPAETFLIEGHTDAVGSDQSNLILSDERADAVAKALTNSFDIPPENLTTQGYGEEFLKVNTDGPNRENRRVTIRRITPLIAPVASNQ
ncbi:MAG: OmpA family protein [Rhizobiaceae bacterium]